MTEDEYRRQRQEIGGRIEVTPVDLTSGAVEGLPSARKDLIGLVLEVPYAPSRAAFHNLRILPRVDGSPPHTCPSRPNSTRTRQAPLVSPASGCLDWYSFRDDPSSLLCAHRDGSFENLQWLRGGLKRHPIAYFRECELSRLLDVIEVATEDLAEREEWTSTDDQPDAGRWWATLQWFEELAVLLRRFLEDDLTEVVEQVGPAPVLLDRELETDDDGKPKEKFSFIVAADTQYHGNLNELRHFLATLDPGMYERLGTAASSSGLPATSPRGHHHLDLLNSQTLAAIRDAKFVILAGDVADGAAASAPLQLIGNYLGILPPKSPYFSDDGDGEFQELRREFRRFGKPIVAVPGNHDGYVGFAGIGNLPLDFLGGELLEATAAGDLLLKINEAIPGLVRLRISAMSYPYIDFLGFKFLDTPGLFEIARYDGLNAFQHLMGPLNVSFRYRNRSFVGLNSYHLWQPKREGAGAVVFNWGGGVTREDAAWFDWALRYHKLRGNAKQQFVFMHQDPRGVTPTAADYDDGSYGSYHHADSWLNLLTGGFGGLGYSSRIMLYLPIVTPTFNYLFHVTSQKEVQQEWMRPPFLPEALDLSVLHWNDCFHARAIVESINENLAEFEGTPNTFRNGIATVFFGHDNVPSAPGYWATRGRVFPPERRWSSDEWSALGYAVWPFTRNPNTWAPAWTETCEVDPERNAQVVRLDDVGDAFGRDHGFHVVTVDGEKVSIEYVRLP